MLTYYSKNAIGFVFTAFVITYLVSAFFLWRSEERRDSTGLFSFWPIGALLLAVGVLLAGFLVFTTFGDPLGYWIIAIAFPVVIFIAITRITGECKNAKRDIDLFFSQQGRSHVREPALNRALSHMTKGTTPERHNVSCQSCWDYYMKMKRKYSGG